MKILFLSIIFSTLTCLSTMECKASASDKEYLVVGLHGIGADGSQIQAMMPQFVQIYAENCPQIDPSKLEIWCPTAPTNNKWFELPGWNPLLALSIGFSLCTSGDVMSTLPNFKQNVDWLKEETEKKLVALNLTHDRLIIAGMSQGGITGLALAAQMPNPVKAVVCTIGMWIPTPFVSYPQHIIMTKGGQDYVIPGLASSYTDEFLKKATQGQSNLEIVTFREDGHQVSSQQMLTIANFLSKNVFNA